MHFAEQLNHNWKIHAQSPKLVMENIFQLIELVSSTDEANQVLKLFTHVSGEHLNDFKRLDQFICELKANTVTTSSFFNDLQISKIENLIKLVSLPRISNLSKSAISESLNLSHFIKVEVLANAAIIKCIQKDFDSCEILLSLAEETSLNFMPATSNIEIEMKLHPEMKSAHRALALFSNNIACSIEEMDDGNVIPKQLLILSARIARQHWEIAGGPTEVARAEYRLAKTFCKIENRDQALCHAKECLKIVKNNQLPPIEEFFAFEVLCFCYQKLNHYEDYNQTKSVLNMTFEKLDLDDQAWCKEILNALPASLYL